MKTLTEAFVTALLDEELKEIQAEASAIPKFRESKYYMIINKNGKPATDRLYADKEQAEGAAAGQWTGYHVQAVNVVPLMEGARPLVTEAFTKQHYITIAAAISDTLARVEQECDKSEVHSTNITKPVEDLAQKLSTVFKNDNPGFDAGLFLSKCGL